MNKRLNNNQNGEFGRYIRIYFILFFWRNIQGVIDGTNLGGGYMVTPLFEGCVCVYIYYFENPLDFGHKTKKSATILSGLCHFLKGCHSFNNIYTPPKFRLLLLITSILFSRKRTTKTSSINIKLVYMTIN